MNSRERVMTAFNHQETDRIPIDLSAHRSSGISGIAYAKLRDHLGLEKKTIRLYDPVQQLAVVDDDVLDRFGVDAIELGRQFDDYDGLWRDWVLPDGTPCQVPYWALPERENGRWVVRSGKSDRIIAHMPDGALYLEQTYYPFAEEDPIDNIPEYLSESMWCALPSPPGCLVDAEGLRDGARRFRERTDRAIVALFGGNLLEMGEFLYGMERFMVLLGENPRRANEFLDKMVEVHLENLEVFLGAVGEYVDIVLFGDDLGGQNGPLISPKMYEDIFKPRHKILWTRAKELADVKTMLHCCGGVRELMPHFIDNGLDSINPVQISCSGMDPLELKREYGKDMVFWGGGCDTRDILPNAGPRQVGEHVRDLMEIWKAGGGFVFQQVHNILADVPPENVVAMFDAVNSGT